MSYIRLFQNFATALGFRPAEPQPFQELERKPTFFSTPFSGFPWASSKYQTDGVSTVSEASRHRRDASQGTTASPSELKKKRKHARPKKNRKVPSNSLSSAPVNVPAQPAVSLPLDENGVPGSPLMHHFSPVVDHAQGNGSSAPLSQKRRSLGTPDQSPSAVEHKAGALPFSLDHTQDIGPSPGPSTPKRLKTETSSEATDQSSSSSVVSQPSLSWLDGFDLSKCGSFIGFLNQQVLRVAEELTATRAESEMRDIWIGEITAVIKDFIPDATVEVFGSSATGLGLPLADIDLVVQSRSLGLLRPLAALQKIAHAVDTARIATDITCVHQARVPIVKFTIPNMLVPVDISYNQQGGRAGVEFVNKFVADSSPGSAAIRALVLLLKLYLKERNYHEVFHGGLGSYAVVCMVVSFLRLHPRIRLEDADEHAFVLLIDLFNFMGAKLDCDVVGISPRNDDQMFDRRSKLANFQPWTPGRKGSPLSIQDPIDPKNNVSFGSYRFRVIAQGFLATGHLLATDAIVKAGLYESMLSGKTPGDIKIVSVLSELFGLDEETIKQRRTVRHCWLEIMCP